MELGGDAVMRWTTFRAHTRWSRRFLVGALGLATMLASGCSKAALEAVPTSPSPRVSAMAGAPSRSPTTTEWIGVLDVAPDPSDLDAETARLAQALGSAFRASPVQCFRGLPDDAGGGYLLGVVASTKAALRSIESRVDRPPLLEARVQELCVD